MERQSLDRLALEQTVYAKVLLRQDRRYVRLKRIRHVFSLSPIRLGAETTYI